MIWWPSEVPTLSYGLTTLRALTPADIPDIYRELQDPVIPQFTTLPANYTMENAEFYVKNKTIQYLAEKKEFAFAIEHDDIFSGVVSLHDIHLADHSAEVGYWIAAPMRRKGVGSAAVRLITDYGFTTMGFRRIEAKVDVKNEGSRALLLNEGYEFEAIMRSAKTALDGTQEDMVLYSALSG